MKGISVGLLTIGMAGCGQAPTVVIDSGVDAGVAVDAGVDGGMQDAGLHVDGGGEPIDLPLALVQTSIFLPDGGIGAGEDLKLIVDIYLGDAGPIEAILDTGSSGVQLAASALPPAALAAITPSGLKYATVFNGAVKASGYIGSATVVLGGRATAAPIQIAVYDQFSCIDGNSCPVGGDLLPSYQFGQYAGYVGVSMRTNDDASLVPGIALGSPIAQLPGQPAFIVEAPDFGGDGTCQRV